MHTVPFLHEQGFSKNSKESGLQRFKGDEDEDSAAGTAVVAEVVDACWPNAFVVELGPALNAARLALLLQSHRV